MATPNDYQFSGHNIHVGYRTFQQGPIVANAPVPPFVTYQDPARSLTFNGDQVQVVETEVGQLVSVVISEDRAIQGGVTTITMSTTFSFLVPKVVLTDRSSPVHTVGITTMYHLASSGQLDTYTTVRLTGTASELERALTATPSA
jgi:hypothetical protein